VSNSSRSCCTATCARSPLVDERAFRHVNEQNQQSIDATLHHTRGRCSPKASRQSSPNSGRTVSFVRTARYLRLLCPRTFCTLPRELSSRRRTLSIVLEELSGVWERPMIISIPTTARPQQRYDDRIRNLVQRTHWTASRPSVDWSRSTSTNSSRAAAFGSFGLGKTPKVVVSKRRLPSTVTAVKPAGVCPWPNYFQTEALNGSTVSSSPSGKSSEARRVTRPIVR
jgi:hypothetical protein